MSKRAYLNTNASHGGELRVRMKLRNLGFNPLPAQSVSGRPAVIVLRGEKTVSIEHAARIAAGRYPVFCQWFSGGNPDEFLVVTDERTLRAVYGTRVWKKHAYLAIVPARL